ncbi:long-chain-fatty-acid--CoA ligase [Leeia sp.]|uniref:long-chain-fatty-acid--CoA ligase n=1 Tax=Leeia sp. TaxID=2884678 RepID=UPI0035B1C458
MEKVWLQHYPAGIPAEIDMSEFSSLADLFEQSVKKYSSRPAFHNMGKSLSYAELDELSARFASYLQNGLGLQKGDRVAVMMPNVLQYPIAMYGILRAGLTVVNVNPLYTPRELEHQLNDSGAHTIVIVENFCKTLQTVIKTTPVKHVIVTALGDMLPAPKSWLVNFVVRHIKKLVPEWHIHNKVDFRDALKLGARKPYRPAELGHEDIAYLQYTGGTTGVSKGAVLTHGNIVANLQQASAWLAPFANPDGEIIITALPLYHIFSLTANCLTFCKLGGCNVLITNPRDMPGFIKELKKHKFTAMSGVNTLFNGLLNRPEFKEVDFSKLKITLGGGMATQRAVAERWKAVTGCSLIEAYGLTETSPAAVINPLNLAEYNGYIGVPIPSTDVELRDDNGQPVGFDTPGELCIKGPQVMRGYWNRPEETAKVLDERGYVATGDVAVMTPDGFLKIVDRKKDMILVSGFNVYPNEIEDVLAQHPGILEVAAIGAQDEHSGEVVMVCIVKKDPNLDEAEVLKFAHKYLTGYKIPKRVRFLTELPKTNVGKILRRELREQMKKAG